MATWQMISTAGAGPVSRTLTYSGTDAQRIFNGWTNVVWKRLGTTAAPTQQDFVNWMANQTSEQFESWVNQNELAKPAPLDITQG